MKRFRYIVFCACLLTLNACVSHEQMDMEEDVVKVSIGLTTTSLVCDASTRAPQPMAPEYENAIRNLWILQFDSEGLLIAKEHKELNGFQLSTTLEDVTLKTGRCTVCIVGNLTEEDTPEWPDNLNGFKELKIDLGWMKELNNGIGDRSVPLFGYYEGEISKATTAINVALGRLICRLNIAISAKNEGVFSNVRIMLKRAQTKSYLFPSDTYLNPDGDYAEEMVTNRAEKLSKDFSYHYYYMAENVTTGTNFNERTQLQIKAVKRGKELTKTIDLGRRDIEDYSILRNNNYTFNIILE